jgi:hypothetical protein
MAVFSQFYKDSNFGGPVESFDVDNGWRYEWIQFGSTLGDEISSLRATAHDGEPGNVFGFTERSYLGNYAALNMQSGWTSWWSYVGDGLNDDIEAAIIVNRNPSGEIVLDLESLVKDQFTSEFDNAVSGTQVSRKGDPRIYTLFWPPHDPGKIFLSIEQDLNIAIDWWPDYDAQVRYDVVVYLTSQQTVDAYVAWVYVWVEGGIFSDKIFNSLQPKLVAGASTLTNAFRGRLALLSSRHFRDLYMLPGPPPSSSFGDIRNAKDGSTLVLVQ